MATDGVLLVMGSGHQQYREYLLASAAQAAPLWLFDPQEPTWQRPHVQGASVLDVFDPEAALAAARELALTTKVLGVFCYHEGVIRAAAHVAEELGVPGPSPAAVASVRDKSTTREKLTAAGFVQPRRALVAPGADAAGPASAVGFPLVAKPRGLGASQGVVKVAGPRELAWALEVSSSATQAGMDNDGGILLEEYLTGPEVSIDAAVRDGEYLPFVVARKRLGGEPYFEEEGHTVSADDPLLADRELLAMLTEAHRTLGWTEGVTHTEVKFTPRGPAIIEVNGRLGGDLIPYLGQLAGGLDSGRIGADLALGIRPRTTPSVHGCAGIRFLYPPRDARVVEVRLPAVDPAAGLLECAALAGPGDELRLPPQAYAARYGYLVATAGTPQECDAILDRAEAAAELDFEPLPVAGS